MGRADDSKVAECVGTAEGEKTAGDRKMDKTASMAADRAETSSRVRLHTDAAILDFYERREVEGWNRYLDLYGHEVWGAKCKEHQLENLAQVYATLKYSKQDFDVWSARFLESLQRQGFVLPVGVDRDALRTVSETMHPCKVCGKLSHCLDPMRHEGKL